MPNDSALLQRMRETSGLSIQEVAVAAGLCHQSVWRAMNGRPVSDDTRATIFNVLRHAVEAKHREAGRLLAQVA